MELLLSGPTLPGRTYEGLVNYDIPHLPRRTGMSLAVNYSFDGANDMPCILPLLGDQELYRLSRRVPEKESSIKLNQ